MDKFIKRKEVERQFYQSIKKSTWKRMHCVTWWIFLTGETNLLQELGGWGRIF
ncbi:hypothetical protein [Selenomonas ruminantium]|uniref:hypothetical protein n=1 Tax=Selenomonas ruminantium TaxID=971 RepID=UPI0012FEACC1|nr:hypothetical protein [Selenomonas ruminantium]